MDHCHRHDVRFLGTDRPEDVKMEVKKRLLIVDLGSAQWCCALFCFRGGRGSEGLCDLLIIIPSSIAASVRSLPLSPQLPYLSQLDSQICSLFCNIRMLQCPPSRINLGKSDIAAFERRFESKKAAAKLAEVSIDNPRLDAGPRRSTSARIVHASDNKACVRPNTCSPQAAIFSECEDEEASVNVYPLRNTLPPPTIRTIDYDEITNTTSRLVSSPAERESIRRARGQRQDGITAALRRSLSPPGLGDTGVRRFVPSRTSQSSWSPGPADSGTRTSRLPSSRHEFTLYEDSAPVQAFIEAQHMRHWHSHGSPNEPHTFLQPASRVTARHSSSHSVFPAATIPVPLPSLNPGAPAFIPRTRFGSGTRGSEENTSRSVRIPRQSGPGVRILSTQSSSNLRIRSSFERNSQHTYRRRDSHRTSIPNVPAGQTSQPQHRRRGHTSDQNAALPTISAVGERYPALRPPTSIPAPRRNSGAYRQVVVQRRSSRQDLTNQPRAVSPVFPIHEQRHASSQSKTSSLAISDEPNSARGSSAARSTNSRSTPNFFGPVSPGPLIHSRGSSLSWERYASRRTSGYRIPSVVSAASGISGSSDGGAHQLRHLPFEGSTLSRGSPLDELMLDFSQFNLHLDDKPTSVGRMEGQSRTSLLSGNIFQQDTSHRRSDIQQQIGIGRHPLKAINDSSFSEEDAVALSLALPSPKDLSSSPTVTSPKGPSLTVAQVSEKATPQSSAAQSPYSVSSIIPEELAIATPRVHVYNDRMSPRTQPQTPADISKSTKQRHTRATTMSQEEVGAVAGGLFSPVIPERRSHRPYTYPVETSSSVVDIAILPARTGTGGGHERQPSLHGNGEQDRSWENDVEGNLAGLEADRRTWMERRENGTLDVTPPREGRFERYLR